MQEEKKIDESPAADAKTPQQKQHQPMPQVVPPSRYCGSSSSAKQKSILYRNNKRASTEPKNANSALRVGFGMMMRIIFLDLPLILSFGLYIATVALERFGADFLIPQLELQRFTPEKAEIDLTYYHRICDASDLTANDTADFVFKQDHMRTSDAVNLMLTHGVAAFPNLLSAETAHQLREFILHENKVSKDLIYVIENQNRWSFPITVDQHPSVSTALEEILNKQHLVDALEAIVGKDPAVIEFTAITSAYGAVGQYWHQDVVPEGNGAKYSRNFIPSYSLFIPLQNVTAKMGATGICPGTHMCAAGMDNFCPELGFQVSGMADNWPLGMGALVNQQTTHRGEPHTDPGAPHRVVFILTFAPRPQFSPQTVETRMIGFHGSYSLHWSQWGHTLRDFQHPIAHMSQPWRAMRSLGLYKPGNKQWGWDYVTVSSCRIANEDTGFSPGDVVDFVEQGGFFWLPKKLHGDIIEEESDAWVYFLQDTVKKCQGAFQLLYQGVLALYVGVGLVLFALAFRSGRRSSTIVRTGIRVFIFHALVLLVARWTLHRVSNSTWGRNIGNQKSFSLPETLALAPTGLPATLPTIQDVLIFEGMQSEYFASFTEVLEVAHPGNNAWRNIVGSYATGYATVSPKLQQEIRLSVLRDALLEQRRILIKNDDGNWAEVMPQHADWFCHRSLLQRSNRYVDSAMRQLDFLLSEARMGYWRDTVLHRRFVSKLLTALQDQILGFRRDKQQLSLSTILVARTWSKQVLGTLQSSLPAIPSSTRVSFQLRQRRGVPPSPAAAEPFPETWLNEGDLIEATFHGDASEWYRGYITYASANRYTWNVEYEDGDEGFDLCSHCVRPYIPYAVNESVEMRVDEYTFAEGRVVGVHFPGDTFDIELEETGKKFYSVKPMNLRRRVGKLSRSQLSPGMRVVALFPGEGDEYYPGIVTKLNHDGTVAIQYDDGDAATVRRDHVEIAQ